MSRYAWSSSGGGGKSVAGSCGVGSVCMSAEISSKTAFQSESSPGAAARTCRVEHLMVAFRWASQRLLASWPMTTAGPCQRSAQMPLPERTVPCLREWPRQ
eukprot:6944745-Lingulodinium_polyedra.AAC.1